MTAPRRDRPDRRAAPRGRVVASGLTAAVTVGTVAAIAGAEASGELDETGTVVGAVAAIEGIDAFRALTAAADPGDAETSSPLPRVGIAGVS